MHIPQQGELWMTSFEPQVGSEIIKTRPALILSSPLLHTLPIKIIVPLQEYKPHHQGKFFLIPITPTKKNGLSKQSSIDCGQIKSFDHQRFHKQIGKIDEELYEEVALTIGLAIRWSTFLR